MEKLRVGIVNYRGAVSRASYRSVLERFVLVAAMLGIALPLIDGLRHLKKTPKPSPIDLRYSSINAVGGRLEFGYISDLPDRGPGLTMFLQAQYGMAPHRLVEGGVHHLTLANLQHPEKLTEICREMGLTPLKIDPAGVALLVKKGTP